MNVDDYSDIDLMKLVEVAEVSERYEDMCIWLKKIVLRKCDAQEPLSVDERNLLSVAYKNVVGAKRQSWRTLSQGSFPGMDDNFLTKYRGVIEKELEDVCREIISLVSKLLEIPDSDEAVEGRIFFLKMSGDYYRYLSEFKQDQDVKDNAAQNYKDAYELAKEKLPETHPTRLGLVLNYSVCCYEIMDKKEEACQLAKEAFDSAIEKLDTLNDSSYKDSTLIMQLLRDNLTLWTTTENQENEDTEK